ncbi:MAG: NTP transferase domain-containing protein [Erysipelotrichaceae bacterium]|nr:NTP transferase domain-containing protein [Erysipelotrichaceae bacterium]MDY5252771.1 sugar phosphate nucleotidyltransferase [Erysipelotrichaceae bacterium]
MKYAIVMAAGKGTRMQSTLPKVMHKVCDKPMIAHLIDNLKQSDVEEIVTIVGYGHEVIEDAMAGQCTFALQQPQLGTGHAVMQAKSLSTKKGKTLVVNGDCPCMKSATFERMFAALDDAKMVVLGAKLEDPKAYGRVVTNEDGMIEKIVEFKDCTEEQKQINVINTGIYAFDNEVLFANLPKLTNENQQKEYYITDLVEILCKQGYPVKAIIAEDNQEVQGINDKKELAEANKYMQLEINAQWMEKGVNIIDPNNTYIGPDVTFAQNVVIYPNVFITGQTVVGADTTIMPNTYIQDAKIGNNCWVDTSRIIDTEIKDGSKIGPFQTLCKGEKK